jgi:hypothetical protein
MQPKTVYQLVVKGQMRFFNGRKEVHVKGVAVSRELIEKEVSNAIERLCDTDLTPWYALDRESVTYEIVEHTVYYE